MVLILLACLWLGGMGGGDGQDGSLALPAENFSVRVTDRQKHTMEVERFTCEGKLHLKGSYGNASLTVPFQKIMSARITPAKDGSGLNTAELELLGGEQVALTVSGATRCYGLTRFGKMEIFLKDVSLIERIKP